MTVGATESRVVLPSTTEVVGASSLATPNRDSEPLPRLLGRYVLLRLLVRGGMGEVYLATTPGIEGAERPCVVKRIRHEYRDDPSFRARFLDEARVQAQLDDPGVVRVLEATLDEAGHPFVALEFVEGRSLAEMRARVVRSIGMVPWPEAVAIALQIGSALAHVHERTGADGAPLGIVHRDLSPQNVMVAFSGDVKLIDFGTARGENRRSHTVAGNVLAKPGYLAPEVARGESASARADLYALGVILWELVSGRRYLQGDPTDHVARVRDGQRPTPLIDIDSNVPKALDAVVSWLTEPVPSSRCGRARDAVAVLAELLTQAPDRRGQARGTRARTIDLLHTLYPNEPGTSRAEFSRLVTHARTRLSMAPAEATEVRSSRRPPDEEGLLPGTRYRLADKIGEGAMGEVYAAEHVDLGRRVALKILRARHSEHPEFTARFRREARAIAGLSHPNLVQVFDFGRTDDVGQNGPGCEWGDRLFFAMELLVGETLEAYVARVGALEVREACRVAIQACHALSAIHEAGLVHRDVKLANLFLIRKTPETTSVKLLDFGVVKGVSPGELGPDGVDDGHSSSLSRQGAIFGTPDTMAPEQIAGHPVDARADVYALGCVLYHLLTGQPPFDGASPVMIMSAHVREAPVAPRQRVPSRAISEAVDSVVMRALRKQPAERFESAAEMAKALDAALLELELMGHVSTSPQANPTEPSDDPQIEVVGTSSLDLANLDVEIHDVAAVQANPTLPESTGSSVPSTTTRHGFDQVSEAFFAREPEPTAWLTPHAPKSSTRNATAATEQSTMRTATTRTHTDYDQRPVRTKPRRGRTLAWCVLTAVVGAGLAVLSAHPTVRPVRERVMAQARVVTNHGRALVHDVLKDEPAPVPKGWSNAIVPQAPKAEVVSVEVAQTPPVLPAPSVSVRPEEPKPTPRHAVHAGTAPRASVPAHRTPTKKRH